MPRAAKLRLFTFRIEPAQLEAARRRAEKIGIPYQQVLRNWISLGAEAERRTEALPSKFPVTDRLLRDLRETVSHSRGVRRRRQETAR